jgi:acyl-coenzyme A thioesterase PaaI-like protein
LTGKPNLPALHGGVIGSFLELTALSEWLFRTGEQDPPTTTSFSMNYLRSDRTQDIFGRAVITRQGREYPGHYLAIKC